MASTSLTAIGEEPSIYDLISTSDQMVRIYIGSTKKHNSSWLLHESVLCYHCPYFKSVFRGNFLESTTKESHLPDDDPLTFSYVVNYLYGSLLKCDCHLKSTSHYPHRVTWIKVFILANKLLMYNLENAALRRYQDCHALGKPLPSISEIEEIYNEHTPPGCYLRDYVELRFSRVFFEDWDNHKVAWMQVVTSNEELLEAVMQRIRSHQQLGNYTSCRYKKCNVHWVMAV
ncbi:uncharacterized protein K444DRAFT_632702 [Hyaloscypha bicolor E]|uniref:BTB domain-containing protein n=1 Tax=Hyaloscypha bicolor E TaxID=1095630 RepID=A0A2J6SZS1_9HELO|nr:uncharacterized protein K444DRAFT_632702 [Hyaloscypha bicolor E]PMD56278.1 hypothetical protein K444DRAFT_632702 [Hyaloscypha bicolor E]